MVEKTEESHGACQAATTLPYAHKRDQTQGLNDDKHLFFH